jgi:hypothetical protein
MSAMRVSTLRVLANVPARRSSSSSSESSRWIASVISPETCSSQSGVATRANSAWNSTLSTCARTAMTLEPYPRCHVWNSDSMRAPA